MTERLAESSGPITAVSDFMAIVPDQVRQFVGSRTFNTLGTDGMGRSDTREALRRFFEIDTGHVVVAVLSGLLADGEVEASVVEDAIAYASTPTPSTPGPPTPPEAVQLRPRQTLPLPLPLPLPRANPETPFVSRMALSTSLHVTQTRDRAGGWGRG